MLSSTTPCFSFRSPSQRQKSPLLFLSYAIDPRKFHVLPFMYKQKQNMCAIGDGRNLQVVDFLERVELRIGRISDFNKMLESLLSADQIVTALKLGSNLSSLGIRPNNSTYSILVKCYCRNNNHVKAKSVVDDMLNLGLKPNAATFTTIVNSFCETGRLADAFEVFDKMSRRGCVPTIHAYNCVLKGLCYVGRIDEAKVIMRRITTKSDVKPDIYTYNAVMNGLCKVGRTIEALELMDEALEMGLSPNVITYNTLFNGYFKQGRPLLGLGLLKRMKETNCKADHISYSTLIHGLLKWGKIKSAYQIYQEMVEDGFQLNERMMNTLLRGLCRRSRQENELLKDVYCVFEKMKAKNCTIYSCAYNLVVEALCRGGKIDSVYETLIEMIEIGYSPNTFSFNIAIHTLCSGGEIDRALRVVLMIHQARKPEGIPFSALINELNIKGRYCEACIVYGMAVKRGVVPKRKPGEYGSKRGEHYSSPSSNSQVLQ